MELEDIVAEETWARPGFNYSHHKVPGALLGVDLKTPSTARGNSDIPSLELQVLSSVASWGSYTKLAVGFCQWTCHTSWKKTNKQKKMDCFGFTENQNANNQRTNF